MPWVESSSLRGVSEAPHESGPVTPTQPVSPPDRPAASPGLDVSPWACEQRERARGRAIEGEWDRHRPQQPSPHREHKTFGRWIDQSPARVTDDPSAITSLVSARAMAPSLLEPAVPAQLAEMAAHYEQTEDGFVRVEPFADAPRGPLKPLTRAERKRLRTDEQRYQEHVQLSESATRRWAALWRELGESADHLPPTADPETYAMCRAVVCSRAAAEMALDLIGRNYGGNVLWRVERSAFGDRSAPRWDLRMLVARRQVALNLFMLRQSRLKLAGRDRHGKPILQPCVWGIGRGYLQSLLADPDTLKPLSRERLTHSNESCDGLFAKSESARVFVRQSKIPPEVVERDEIGPSGYTFNRYWVSRHWNAKRALREEPDAIDATEASAQAWAWLDEGIRAALRGRFLRPRSSVDAKWIARESAPS